MRWSSRFVRLAVAASAISAGVCALPTPASASPQDLFGFGPRSIAMAGGGASIGWGFETVRTNPSLLALDHERSLSTGWLAASYDLDANGHLPAEAVSGSIIGGTLPLPFEGFLKDRLTLGFGFFTPYKLVARAHLLYPEKPKFPIADRAQSVTVQLGLGADLGYGIRLGVGFAALAGLTGSVIVATDASGRVGTVVEDTLIAAYGLIVGASRDFGPYRLGLTYRGQLSGPFDVVIQVRDLGSIVVPPLHISGTAQYDPHQLEVELTRTLGNFQVALGATYRRWSDYPGAVQQTVRCPDPVPGEDPVECDPLIPEPPHYSDTVAPRVAAEGVFTIAPGIALKGRAGYAFEPSPAPEQTGVPNDFDNHRSVIGLGYGLSLSRPFARLDFDLFSQIQVLHDRDHHKPDGTVFRTHGTLTAFGATVGVNL